MLQGDLGRGAGGWEGVVRGGHWSHKQADPSLDPRALKHMSFGGVVVPGSLIILIISSFSLILEESFVAPLY